MVRVQVPQKARLVRFFLHPVGKTLLVLFVLTNLAIFVAFSLYYTKYAKLIDQKLIAGPFAATSKLYAAPEPIMVGDEMSIPQIVNGLRRAGYSESRTDPTGWYHVRPDGVDIFPGPNSYFRAESGVVKVTDNKVTQIISLRDNTERTVYYLEPQLITNLFDRNREKRRLVRFEEIPPVLVNAVVSAEDKRFFQHAGFDPLRILKAVYRDIKERRKAEGASTLSQQLARQFFLNTDKTWNRKLLEVVVTMHLENKLTKEKIFEYYANQIPLGRRGSFSIHGFGEASQAFFGKDIKDLTLAEAATLAGLIQRPSYYNPYKWPDRARTRRNIILILMRENGYITAREYEDAAATEVKLAGPNSESTDAPYFVDLVNDWLQTHFQDVDFQSDGYRVYTSLDLNLQRAAYEAVQSGMKEIDDRIRKRLKGKDDVMPQVALIALDPQTGEIKALVGGRDYGASQINHAIAKRPPGSSFKPFVYAAALNTGLNDNGGTLFTPVTLIEDEPTTFYYDNKPYEPTNFKHEWHGTVTLRQALAKSMNVPTVKIAEAIGYRNVVDLARRAGLNMDIQPTPAVALGAYDVQPLEIAGAYTMFANRGVATQANFLKAIWNTDGQRVAIEPPRRSVVLDPRVNYLMVNLMEEVLRSGTGAGVRQRGFSLPAAGKTGTSHDGWFAGFTSKLICVVWVGYDDYRELKMEGAHTALPIWADFMKKAHTYRPYRNVQGFEAPEGIVSVDIDPASGQLATPSCPSTRVEFFLSGTQPVEVCHLHGGGTQVAGWDMPAAQPPVVASSGGGVVTPRPSPNRGSLPATAPPPLPQDPAEQPGQPKQKERKGFLGRIRDIFK